MPRAWDASFLHEHLEEALDGAEQYILSAPLEILGKLAVSADGIPVELTQADQPEIILRAATEEPEVMPQPSAGLTDWSGKGPWPIGQPIGCAVALSTTSSEGSIGRPVFFHGGKECVP